MNRNKYRLYLGLILIASTLLFSGCAVFDFFKSPAQDTGALSLVKNLQNRNKGIETCKGTGWLTLSSGTGKIKKFRMAWAASFPDRIRMTLLSAGHPIETIIADGKKVTLISHTGNHSLQIINSANPSLKNIISIPITMQDIIILFTGRIPLGKFDYAHFGLTDKKTKKPDKKISTEKKENAEKPEHPILFLKKKWTGETQKIFLDANGNVLSLQLADKNQKPYYSVSFKEYVKHKSFTVPIKININEHSGNPMSLEITSFMVNIPIKPSVFNLTDQR